MPVTQHYTYLVYTQLPVAQYPRRLVAIIFYVDMLITYYTYRWYLCCPIPLINHCRWYSWVIDDACHSPLYILDTPSIYRHLPLSSVATMLLSLNIFLSPVAKVTNVAHYPETYMSTRRQLWVFQRYSLNITIRNVLQSNSYMLPL